MSHEGPPWSIPLLLYGGIPPIELLALLLLGKGAEIDWGFAVPLMVFCAALLFFGVRQFRRDFLPAPISTQEDSCMEGDIHG